MLGTASQTCSYSIFNVNNVPVPPVCVETTGTDDWSGVAACASVFVNFRNDPSNSFQLQFQVGIMISVADVYGCDGVAGSCYIPGGDLLQAATAWTNYNIPSDLLAEWTVSMDYSSGICTPCAGGMASGDVSITATITLS